MGLREKTQYLTNQDRQGIIKKPSIQDGQKGALHKRQAVSPPTTGGSLFPRKGGIAMVTYSELFAYSLVLLSVATLFYQIGKHTGKRK